jgi:hypothetical protein
MLLFSSNYDLPKLSVMILHRCLTSDSGEVNSKRWPSIVFEPNQLSKLKGVNQMNTMQSFYTSLSSNKPVDAYLKILAEITKLSREQMQALKSDLAWQDWSAEKVTQAEIQE